MEDEKTAEMIYFGRMFRVIYGRCNAEQTLNVVQLNNRGPATRRSVAVWCQLDGSGAVNLGFVDASAAGCLATGAIDRTGGSLAL